MFSLFVQFQTSHHRMLRFSRNKCPSEGRNAPTKDSSFAFFGKHSNYARIFQLEIFNLRKNIPIRIIQIAQLMRWRHNDLCCASLPRTHCSLFLLLDTTVATCKETSENFSQWNHKRSFTMNFNPNIIEVFRWASSRPIHSVAIHGLRYKHLDIEMSLESQLCGLSRDSQIW